jgi:hypothetical protein
VAKQTNNVTVEKGGGDATGLVALCALLGFLAFLAFLGFVAAMTISCVALLARSIVLQRGAKAAVLWEYRNSTAPVYGPQGPMWPNEPPSAALSHLARTRRRSESTTRQAIQQLLIGRVEPQEPAA